jgi:signal transduction histidine kinase
VDQPLCILILEDVASDAELIERELRRTKIPFSSRRADSRESFLKELEDFRPDLVLSDYYLPDFDGLAALAICREQYPDIPFILVSGAIGEETAIEAIKSGATDFVLKDKLFRLAYCVARALREVQERAERRQAQQALSESEEELKRLSARLLTTQENERHRIARELHDSIGQMLTAIKFRLEGKIHQMGKGSPSGKGAIRLEDIVALVKTTMDEIRRISTDLWPSMLEDLGILATIKWFCRDFQTIFAKVRVVQQIHLEECDVPHPLKIVIYRILQESMNNAAKYSRGDLITVSLRKLTEGIELIIHDNGKGFDPKTCRKGVGLASMTERAASSGGSLKILSRKGSGTIVRAFWPQEKEDSFACSMKKRKLSRSSLPPLQES